MQVIAIRDIYPGEELCSCYIFLQAFVLDAFLSSGPNFLHRCHSTYKSTSASIEWDLQFRVQLSLVYFHRAGSESVFELSEELWWIMSSTEWWYATPDTSASAQIWLGLRVEHALVRCSKCKSVVRSVDAALDALRVGQEGLDKANNLQFEGMSWKYYSKPLRTPSFFIVIDPGKSIRLTTNLIPILTSAGFPPSAHPLLGLTRLHQQLLTSSFPNPLTQEHLDETIHTATTNVAGLTALFREGHPVLALALAELGKLLAVDEPSPRTTNKSVIYPPSGLPRLKLAYETLLRARKMLLIGFGVTNEGGQVGKEVREMIVALEKEIGVFRQGIKNVLEDTPKLKA